MRRPLLDFFGGFVAFPWFFLSLLDAFLPAGQARPDQPVYSLAKYLLLGKAYWLMNVTPDESVVSAAKSGCLNAARNLQTLLLLSDDDWRAFDSALLQATDWKSPSSQCRSKLSASGKDIVSALILCKKLAG